MKEKLIEGIRFVSVPAIDSFVVAEKFCPGEVVDGIRISWIGENFRKHYLPKTEGGVATREVAVNRLLTAARNYDIIIAFGERVIEVTLGQFWTVLKTADRKFWYVAYIKNAGIPWAVGARWSSVGLRVDTGPFFDSSRWRAGCRFILPTN